MSILDTHAWFTGSVHSYGSISASQGFSGSFSGDGSGLTGVVVQGVISSSAQVDHNETRNYTASRHIDHASVYITGSGGLTGGGVITTSQAIELDTNSSTFIGGVKSYAYYSSSISSSLITLYKDAGGNHTLDLSGVTGGVSSYTDLTNIPENIISSSVQIAALGFITSSSLGLSTKAGSIPSSSFQNTGSDSYADVVFATPFSSSNYSVAVLLNSNEYNVGAYPESFHIHNKTTTGFRVVNGYSVDVFWGAYPGATLDYIAVAYGETAVTSSFTELASTASYVDFTNIGNLPTLISGSSQISALGFLTSSSLGLNTKVGNIPSSSFLASGSLTVAQVTFATPFSSSNYAVSAQYNDSIALGANSPLDIKSKTAAGFEIVSPNNVFAWNDRPGSSVDYIAVAYGETAVTSSFTELASTASYAITASYALNAGGVTSYTELSNIPENIISSSIQIASLGFLTSSSLGLNTKVGTIPTSSFLDYNPGIGYTNSSASVVFATPFSSSNYQVFIKPNLYSDTFGDLPINSTDPISVINKTTTGFNVVSTLTKYTWGSDFSFANISYVAIADGETAVTSSFTELASTASYVDFSNVDNLPTLISGSAQISALGFLTSSSLGLNTKVGNISSSSFQNTGSDSYADVVFATPFSSSNYSVAVQLNYKGNGLVPSVDSFLIQNKSTTGFRILNDFTVQQVWSISPNSSVDYIAVAHGETAVTSSFTELASTASYVEYSNVANKPTLLSGSQQIAGDISGSLGANATLIRSLTASSISGSFISLSGSIAANIAANASSVGSLNAASSSYLLNTTDTLTGNLTVTGTITAQEFHTEFVSASIIFQSGSTKFGNSVDDTHQFTGSVLVKGDLLPGLNEQYDLGSASNRWKDLYLSGSTIYLGDAQISEASWNAVSSSASSTYTLPAATSTVRGGIELFSNTVQSVAANAVSTTAGRTYGVQVNSDGQAVVNIPWTDTDTNTTYSAGNGLGLSGTEFSLDTPSTLSVSSTNGVTVNSHTHAITTTTTGAASTIVATDSNSEITAANFITTSDRRLKADITPIQEGLETIKKFVSYEYTKNGLKEAGFIAQEVQEALPYAVREGEDGFLRMTDRAILAHMHKAILELEQKIKEIENKL